MNKWDRRFIELAEHISTWSRDPSTKVGSVITNSNNKVLGLGYNGFPRGVDDSEELYLNKEIKYSRVVHAEVNAILNAAQSLEGATIYTSALPTCNECAKLVIQAGIKRVVTPVSSNEHWEKIFKISEQMYKESGVSVTKYDKDHNEIHQ